MSKKTNPNLAKTVISASGKTATTTYPDGRVLIQMRTKGSPDFQGPREPYKPAPSLKPIPAPAPKPPTYREQLRKQLGLDTINKSKP